MTTAQQIIDHLNLQPHPEGGFFKETYRSDGNIPATGLPAEYDGPRYFSTCIYFLLTADAFSAFHRVRQDEAWHFYAGSPLKIHAIDPQGNYTETLIGNNFEKGEVPQHVVPGGYWFGAEVVSPGEFTLVGCTVAPGFDFADFELAERSTLTEKFPQHRSIIEALTRG